MINYKEKSFNLKNIFVTIICLIIGFSFSTGFALLTKTRNNENVSVSAVGEIGDSSALTLNWSKLGTGYSSKMIKPLAQAKGTSDTDSAYHFSISNNFPDEIEGGTQITISTSNKYTINFTDSKGTYSVTLVEHNGYKLKKFYFGNDKNSKVYEYDISSTNSFSITPEDVDPTYTKKLVFSAECEERGYGLNMYYEDVDESGKGTGLLSETPLRAQTYGISEGSLLNLDLWVPSVSPQGKAFGYWMLNLEEVKEVVAAEDLTFTKNANSSKVTQYTMSKDVDENLYNEDGAFSITFGVHAINPYNENLVYVSSIRGWGELTIYQSVDRPIVCAKYSNEYNLTIDNTNNIYWESQDISTTKDSNGKLLYGAFSSEEGEDTTTTNTTAFTIKHNEGYSYPFMASEYDNNVNDKASSVFFKQQDFENGSNSKAKASAAVGSYYVFNYGYRIKAWTIRYSIGSDIYYGIYNENSAEKWVFKHSSVATNQEKEIPIEKLISLSGTDALGNTTSGLAFYAERLDNKLQTDLSVPEITMVPVWEEVSISVFDQNETKLNNQPIRFGNVNGYTLNGNDAEGKSLMYYYFYEGASGSSPKHIIALFGVWNYRNIPYGHYIFNKGDNSYSINVNSAYVDDVYQVKLTNVKTFKPNEYVLTNCDFAFESNGLYFANRYTFKNLTDYKTFNAFGESLIDNYIENGLKGYESNYLEGIDGDGNNDYQLFKKVYTTQGTIDSSKLKLTVTGGQNPEFYIYLANSQKTGALPVFDKEYYSLIMWQNTVEIEVENNGVFENKQYSYVTNEYDRDVHGAELTDFITRTEDMVDNIWCLSDGYEMNGSSYVITLEAYYFRKYYHLDIETYLDGANIGRYGYVKVSIVDVVYQLDKTIDNMGGNYLVIFEDGKMEVFNVGAQTSLVDSSNNIQYRNNEYDKEKIMLYAGCDITLSVFDQSQDVAAMNSGKFDEMIGYKFAKSISQVQRIFANSTNGDDYQYYADAESIENNNYQNASIVEIDVYFNKIIYNVNIKIDNVNAGEFNIQENSIISSYKVSYELRNMVVGNYYQINHYAFAGFTLQSNAFVLKHENNKNNTLQGYDDAALISQIYTIAGGGKSFDGTWLRAYLYDHYTDYDVEQVNIGLLTIQTDVLNFAYGIKVFDDSNSLLAGQNYLLETVDNIAIISLDPATSAVNTIPVSTHLDNDLGFYYYESTKNYALLASRLYFVKNHTSKSNNYYTTYDFLLTIAPTAVYEIGPYHISYMVDNFESGTIIPSQNRKLYIMLDVRELLSVNMQVEKQSKDTNSTQRSTTITNGTNNNVTFIVAANASHDGGYYMNASGNTTVSIYSYVGAVNDISSVYDSNRYFRVEYYLDDMLLQTNKFTLIKNSTITIKFVPRYLETEITYMLDGVVVDEVEAKMYIENESRPTMPGYYYLSESLNYRATITNEDYNLRVSMNNSEPVSTTDIERQINYTYTVVDADFDFEKLNLLVEISMKDNSKIRITYQLIDSSKKFADDNYGVFAVKENSTLKIDNVSVAEISVIENRNVYVELGLNTGYVYRAVKHNTFEAKEVELDGNGRLILIDGYNPELDSGDYLILLDKVDVTAELNTEGLKASYSINGKQLLTDLYVGSTIKLENIDVDEERLQCFYYYNASQQKVYLTENGLADGNPIKELKVTSALLDSIGGNKIVFGVVAVNRYRLDLLLTGEEYLATDGLKIVYKGTNDEYVLGTYCDNGTELSITISTKVLGKYNINFNGVDYDIVEGEVGELVLDRHHNYEVVVTPKTYNVEIEEYLYEMLSQVIAKDPMVLDGSEHVNAAVVNGVRYNEQAVVEFARVVVDDRELGALFIEHNDSEYVIEIEFNGTEFVAYVDGVSVDLSDYGYAIEFTNYGTAKLSYTTYNNISLRMDYKAYKFIDNA